MNSLRLSFLMLAMTLAACGPNEASVTGGDEQTMELESALASGRFESFLGRDGQHYFHLLAGNGEKVLASEGYTTASAAAAGIATVKANGADPGRYLLREAADTSWYLVLTAANGQIISVSEMYASRSGATGAIATVSRLVRNTVVEKPAVQGAARFEVFRGLDSKFYFHVRARNGQIVLQSQGYASRSGALAGVTTVQTNGALASRYQVHPAADGKSYFVLRAANGQIIGFSETYASKYNAERGAAAVLELLAAGASR